MNILVKALTIRSIIKCNAFITVIACHINVIPFLVSYFKISELLMVIECLTSLMKIVAS